MWRALQWEMYSSKEDNNPLGIMEHLGETGFQEKDGGIKRKLHQG